MKIALLGDIGLIGNYDITKNRKLPQKLLQISNYLKGFDLVVGNLETPFSSAKKTWGAKSSYICSDPDNIAILKQLNIHAVTIANNHMFDYGQEGFNTTIDTLTKNGIEWFGANGKCLKIEYGNNKLAFNGFCCYSTNPQKIAKKYGEDGINRFNINEVLHIIKQEDKDGWLNIIAIHSGIEHVNYPSIDQIIASRLLADSTPIIWYGHHPHVIQGIELYKDSLIAHSLGNFCFSGNSKNKNRPIINLSENNRRGLILEIEIENNKLISHKETVIHFDDYGEIIIHNSDSDINDYSTAITNALVNQEDYNYNRNQQRKEYLQGRMKLRNLSWVIKRLTPRYLRLYLCNKRNIKLYAENVSKFLR